MATLNGANVRFTGLSFSQIGEVIVKVTQSDDGKGINLVLTPEEQNAFERAGGMAVGYTIVDLVVDAVLKKTGKKPEGLEYSYKDFKFTT